MTPKWKTDGKYRFIPLVGYPTFGVLIEPDGTPRPVACMTLKQIKEHAPPKENFK